MLVAFEAGGNLTHESYGLTSVEGAVPDVVQRRNGILAHLRNHSRYVFPARHVDAQVPGVPYAVADAAAAGVVGREGELGKVGGACRNPFIAFLQVEQQQDSRPYALGRVKRVGAAVEPSAPPPPPAEVNNSLLLILINHIRFP